MIARAGGNSRIVGLAIKKIMLLSQCCRIIFLTDYLFVSPVDRVQRVAGMLFKDKFCLLVTQWRDRVPGTVGGSTRPRHPHSHAMENNKFHYTRPNNPTILVAHILKLTPTGTTYPQLCTCSH